MRFTPDTTTARFCTADAATTDTVGNRRRPITATASPTATDLARVTNPIATRTSRALDRAADGASRGFAASALTGDQQVLIHAARGIFLTTGQRGGWCTRIHVCTCVCVCDIYIYIT